MEVSCHFCIHNPVQAMARKVEDSSDSETTSRGRKPAASETPSAPPAEATEAAVSPFDAQESKEKQKEKKKKDEKDKKKKEKKDRKTVSSPSRGRSRERRRRKPSAESRKDKSDDKDKKKTKKAKPAEEEFGGGCGPHCKAGRACRWSKKGPLDPGGGRQRHSKRQTKVEVQVLWDLHSRSPKCSGSAPVAELVVPPTPAVAENVAARQGPTRKLGEGQAGRKGV